MKAAQIKEYGDASAVEVVEVNVPKIADGQVLIEVKAASLNPFDTMVRAGYLKEAIPLQLPFTLGGDIAGVVREVGAGVDGFAVGDAIYGQANVVAGNSGAFAEFAATKASQIAHAPGNVSEQEAAALPLVGVSALQALKEHINLQPNQKIFIHGGAGAIGVAAIQIAKNIGADIAVTATGDDIEFVKSLGADTVIDYKAEKFSELLSDYDAVFDTVGGTDFTDSLQILKKGGVAVSMTAQVSEEKAQELGVTAISQMTHVTTEMLDTLRELIESNVVTPFVDSVYRLEDIQQAFTKREAGHARTKIVLSIN